MKYLYINGELAGEAEKIFVDTQKRQIVGYNVDSDTPAFALRGVKFENITYEIKDEQGNPVESDIDEMTQLKQELESTQEALDYLIMGGM